jgi:glyoxylase-like metal-dependent hydrolase (beta-lactamase superfamily II)
MPVPTPLTRRALLRSSSLLAGTALAARCLPSELWGAQSAPTAAAGRAALAARRAEMGKAPIQRTRLAANLELLAGPGGNVAVVHGQDGLVLVDTFVKPAWPALKTTLDAIGGKVAFAIDTHWHYDHADNNASLHEAGARIVAHRNTKTRLSEAHDIIGLHIDPEPPEALPQTIFADAHAMRANGEDLVLQYVPPAHTDTDIYVHFKQADVLHLGDLFFNGFYPFIDGVTGGTMNGMVAAAERSLKVAGASTRIVPGHGPLGDRAALQRYHRMLATIRDRVGKLKAAGKSVADAQAAQPTKDFDAEWGGGFMKPADFVALVYGVL